MMTTLVKSISILAVLFLLTACGEKLEEKGFQVGTLTKDENTEDGISKDSLTLATRPNSVLITGFPQYRLATIYKVNYRDDSTSFIGSNDYYSSYGGHSENNGNQWNYNFMPGLEALYGYNLVNISHYDTETQAQQNFFEKPVLVKTLYYPSFSKDTLNY